MSLRRVRFAQAAPETCPVPGEGTWTLPRNGKWKVLEERVGTEILPQLFLGKYTKSQFYRGEH